jgi:hypothetical protein
MKLSPKGPISVLFYVLLKIQPLIFQEVLPLFKQLHCKPDEAFTSQKWRISFLLLLNLLVTAKNSQGNYMTLFSRLKLSCTWFVVSNTEGLATNKCTFPGSNAIHRVYSVRLLDWRLWSLRCSSGSNCIFK